MRQMIQTDFRIDFVRKVIDRGLCECHDRTYTYNEFFLWLVDAFDKPPSMDDDVPITRGVNRDGNVVYKPTNGWKFTRECIRFLEPDAVKSILKE